MTTRAAIYSRVSTSDKGQDLTLQSSELRDYCARQGWELLEYEDQASASASKARPGFSRMMKDAMQRRFGVLVVWKLDRLFRSMQQCVNTLEELRQWKVRFVSLRDGLDLPGGEEPTSVQNAMLHMFAMFAQFERDLIRERVKAGMAHANAKGRALGRRRVIVDAGQVKRLREAGRSWHEIGLELGKNWMTCRRAYFRYVRAAAG